RAARRTAGDAAGGPWWLEVNRASYVPQLPGANAALRRRTECQRVRTFGVSRGGVRVEEPTIAELRGFTLKGGAGIQVREWPLDAFGPVHDRRWMVVDEQGTFVSQRSDPSLGQVRTSFDDGVLVLESATAGVLRLGLPGDNAGVVPVRV